MGARPDRRLLALLQVQVARPLVITKHVLFPGILAPRDARRAASLRVQATLWRFRWEARTVARRRPTFARRVAVGRSHSHTLGITVAIWALGGAGTGDGFAARTSAARSGLLYPWRWSRGGWSRGAAWRHPLD